MPDPYTQLLEWRRQEGAARGLAKLPHDFYVSTNVYLADVKRTFERELRENPSGKKGELARQTHQRAVQIARDIVEARVTKILSQAFQASVGGSRDLANALEEERHLFDQTFQVLRRHRTSAAAFLDAGAPANVAPADPAATPGPLPAAAPPTTTPTRAKDPPPAPSATALVRIVKDGRPVEVGNETIDLRNEDVLSLPHETARLLVGAKIAEMIVPANERPIT